MSNIIQGLFWPKLTSMEQMSIRSFLENGYEYHLYAYGPVEGVPDGAIVKDANEIMPYQEYPHIAQFADHFRYKLLYERGGWWVDMDVICLKPFDFEEEYVFSSEAVNVNSSHLNNVIVKAPAGSPIMKYLLDRCESVDKKTMLYTTLGPILMEDTVRKFGLQSFVKPPQVFCPIPFWEWERFLKKEKLADFKNSYSLHFWHEMWRRAKRPTNVFTGLYSEIHAKYGWGKGKIFMGLVTCDQPKYQNLTYLCLNSWAKTLPDNFDLKVCTGAVLGVPDDYNSLQLKTKALVIYSKVHHYDGTIKIDDDVFVRTDKLVFPSEDYAGWASLDNYQHECPWAHCQGGFYCLSKRAMDIIAEAPFYPKHPNKCLAKNEDSWVGWSLKENGIHPHMLKNVMISPTWQWASQTYAWRNGDVPKTDDWMVMTQINERDFYNFCPELNKLKGAPPPIVPAPRPRPQPVVGQVLRAGSRLTGRTIPFIDRRKPRG